LALVGACTTLPTVAHAQLNVFACEPEWAALASVIGGELTNVKSATNAYQDAHRIRAKPSLLAAMRKADIVFCSGAGLELGWLPILIRKAGGRDVQPGAIGWIMASDHIAKLEIMDKVDRSMGDVHPEGNPHVHLDPRNISVIAHVLNERLSAIDPDNRHTYDKNFALFSRKWDSKIEQWQAQAAPLEGRQVVVYHKAWMYLLNWLGMTVVATLEPKPGLPPTASHLEKTLRQLKSKEILAVLVAPYENEKPATWLASKANLPVLKLPYTVGGSDEAVDLVSLFDETITRLVKEK